MTLLHITSLYASTFTDSMIAIRDIFDKVKVAIGDTRADVRRYSNDCPAFRETAEKMLPAWETSLET